MSKTPWGQRQRCSARWINAYWKALREGREVRLMPRWPLTQLSNWRQGKLF